MEREAVVVAVLGEETEILDRHRRISLEEHNLDGALAGFDDRVPASRAFLARRHFAVVGWCTACGHPEADTAQKKHSECSRMMDRHETRIVDLDGLPTAAVPLAPMGEGWCGRMTDLPKRTL